ncbi:hypothetical protein CHS0354_008082 [Potamilus streckersoni]|uniref:P2X purinoceptor 7-like n=1 Tax=Potamilus streckersoni TaxID=2493646 RepID=A0AAE0VR20_9BIVA|nr:hypothetical protein CHS0354_008082 [Potamilus streckersoni]
MNTYYKQRPSWYRHIMEKSSETQHESCDSEGSELSLSCASSPFEDSEVLNLEDSDNGVEAAAGSQINPYQFEAYISNTDESEIADDDDEEERQDRLTDNSWCNCGHCLVMPTSRECVCCCDVEKVTSVCNGYQGIQYITDHPGFRPVCLDIHVLKVAYYQYRQQFGERPEQGNERHRYTSYRQFARLCWHFLGKEVRVIFPSCVV